MSALNSARSVTPDWAAQQIAVPAFAHVGARPKLVSVPPLEPEASDRVGLERTWREPPGVTDSIDPERIVARRWRDDRDALREHSIGADPRFAVIAVALRRTSARLVADGECVHDGAVPPGFAALTWPGLSLSVQFRSACDILHLFIPHQRLSEMARQVDRQPTDASRLWLTASDPLIERLCWLLLKGGGVDEVRSSSLYRDGIALAIASRLLGRSPGEGRTSGGLVKWRLKRVQQLIEEQLSEPLSLADLARCAGLSRMHFAAQFRAATGMRPHEYLVRRRIQRAQEILLTTSMPLVEVALSVGFQTQAHFTTVFRRFLGETPGRWREAQRLC